MTFYKHPSAIIESKEIGDGTKIWHFVHVREGAKIGANCNIGKGAYIDTGVNIGNNVKIQNFVNVYQGVRIEDDVFVGPSATFTNDIYPRAFIWGESRVGGTMVRRGASIGANATIVCGVTIGEYAMVGAGSVVTKDIPPFNLYYGNPARFAGFICHCGKRLEKLIEECESESVYECACGKTVRINGEWK